MSRITSLHAIEILDSRARPTVKAYCTLESGAKAEVSVPSGASTGIAEALELRDGDPKRYNGLGCQKAVENISSTIRDALVGRDFATQTDLDAALLELDGTPDKSKLGANAILGVSLAFARAQAAEANIPLYHHFASMWNGVPLLPKLTINLFSGGKHAGGQVPIQDVLVVPVAAKTIDEGLAMTYDVYQAAAKLTAEKYNTRPLKADEGGLAPPFPSVDAMLADAVTAIECAGYIPGEQVALAVDVASSHFYSDGRYYINDQALDSTGMVSLLMDWLDRYPIISVEDGLSEEDWAGWQAFYQAAQGKAMILGDDLLCTNPKRIQQAVDSQAANSLLLKVNQIGTLTEAFQSCQLARHAGWKVVVSARSGETEDNWLADLAVGWAGDYIKIGSIMQSERLAKYNRLLEIEAFGVFSSYPIEILKVSAECLEAMRRVGTSSVGDLTMFFEYTMPNATFTTSQEFANCWDEIVAQLKAQGFWPEHLKWD